MLLSFDTEFEPDADALGRLGVTVPATFFFTGQYAATHPGLLKRLADAGHTIGSHGHSHADLTTLTPAQAEQELIQSRQVIEAITGTRVAWFRAPYLSYDLTVMQAVRDTGYLRDSSDNAHWPRNETLPGLPISHHKGRLASDYELFERDALSDTEALDWLLDAYRTRATHGQPLVLLLHPRIIARHRTVLQRFIWQVAAEGGVFQTMDTYWKGLAHPPARPIVALMADIRAGHVPSGDLMRDAAAIGATDIFLSLGNGFASHEDGTTGRHDALARAIAGIQTAGLRAHVKIRLNPNPRLAAAHPDYAMQNGDGARTTGWVSPSHAGVRADLVKRVKDLLDHYGFDGVLIEGIGYPGLDRDFSPPALKRFSDSTGIPETDPNVLMADHYQEWVDWRMRETAEGLETVRGAAREIAGRNVVVSVALAPEAASHYLPRERKGLDVQLVSRASDLIVLLQPLEGDAPLTRRQLYAVRWQTGDTPVVVAFDRIGTGQALETALGNALVLSSGVAVPRADLFACLPDAEGPSHDTLGTVLARLRGTPAGSHSPPCPAAQDR